jgi:hypothetical protein
MQKFKETTLRVYLFKELPKLNTLEAPTLFRGRSASSTHLTIKLLEDMGRDLYEQRWSAILPLFSRAQE